MIVTVLGYQVGRVNGRLYPLDRELELRADRRGHVSLLVQNHRNGQLTPLTVRLEPADRQRDPLSTERIIGTISLRRLTTLARGAVLTVRLLDVTDRRLPAQAIARQTLRELGPLPIPFELTYDKDDIKPGRKYALDAEVTVNGLAALRTRALSRTENRASRAREHGARTGAALADPRVGDGGRADLIVVDFRTPITSTCPDSTP